MNRRKFIGKTAFIAGGAGLMSISPGITKRFQPLPPSDKLNIALIGCRNMGFGILQHHLSNPGVNCVAMCDIDDKVLNDRSAEVLKSFNQKPKLYKDFRKLFEQKDIDAVIIGTPDHWHCLLTIYALQAGKDVYVEKPMANTIAECNIMVKAANYYSNRIVQVGQQQRSGFVFQKAMELIKNDMTAGVQLGPFDSPYGLVFIGDNATLVTDRSKLLLHPEWDDEAGRFTNSEAANQLITPVYREPWVLPKF